MMKHDSFANLRFKFLTFMFLSEKLFHFLVSFSIGKVKNVSNKYVFITHRLSEMTMA